MGDELFRRLIRQFFGQTFLIVFLLGINKIPHCFHSLIIVQQYLIIFSILLLRFAFGRDCILISQLLHRLGGSQQGLTLSLLIFANGRLLSSLPIAETQGQVGHGCQQLRCPQIRLALTFIQFELATCEGVERSHLLAVLLFQFFHVNLVVVDFLLQPHDLFQVQLLLPQLDVLHLVAELLPQVVLQACLIVAHLQDYLQQIVEVLFLQQIDLLQGGGDVLVALGCKQVHKLLKYPVDQLVLGEQKNALLGGVDGHAVAKILVLVHDLLEVFVEFAQDVLVGLLEPTEDGHRQTLDLVLLLGQFSLDLDFMLDLMLVADLLPDDLLAVEGLQVGQVLQDPLHLVLGAVDGQVLQRGQRVQTVQQVVVDFEGVVGEVEDADLQVRHQGQDLELVAVQGQGPQVGELLQGLHAECQIADESKQRVELLVFEDDGAGQGTRFQQGLQLMHCLTYIQDRQGREDKVSLFQIKQWESQKSRVLVISNKISWLSVCLQQSEAHCTSISEVCQSASTLDYIINPKIQSKAVMNKSIFLGDSSNPQRLQLEAQLLEGDTGKSYMAQQVPKNQRERKSIFPLGMPQRDVVRLSDTALLKTQFRQKPQKNAFRLTVANLKEKPGMFCCRTVSLATEAIIRVSQFKEIEIRSAKEGELLYYFNLNTVEVALGQATSEGDAFIMSVSEDIQLKFQTPRSDPTNPCKQLLVTLRTLLPDSMGVQYHMADLKTVPDFHLTKYKPAIQFTNHAQTGDILLFRSFHFLAKVQRLFTNSEYDHVAMVIRDRSSRLLIYESTSGSGVCLWPWSAFLAKRWYLFGEKFVWRKLEDVSRNDVFMDKLQQSVETNKKLKYLFSFQKLATNHSYVRPDQREQAQTQAQTQQTAEAGYFCSELIAQTYKDLQLLTRDSTLKDYKPSCNVIPYHWSQKYDLKLTKGVLSEEYTLHFNDAAVQDEVERATIDANIHH